MSGQSLTPRLFESDKKAFLHQHCTGLHVAHCEAKTGLAQLLPPQVFPNAIRQKLHHFTCLSAGDLLQCSHQRLREVRALAVDPSVGGGTPVDPTRFRSR